MIDQAAANGDDDDVDCVSRATQAMMRAVYAVRLVFARYYPDDAMWCDAVRLCCCARWWWLCDDSADMMMCVWQIVIMLSDDYDSVCVWWWLSDCDDVWRDLYPVVVMRMLCWSMTSTPSQLLIVCRKCDCICMIIDHVTVVRITCCCVCRCDNRAICMIVDNTCNRVMYIVAVSVSVAVWRCHMRDRIITVTYLCMIGVWLIMRMTIRVCDCVIIIWLIMISLSERCVNIQPTRVRYVDTVIDRVIMMLWYDDDCATMYDIAAVTTRAIRYPVPSCMIYDVYRGDDRSCMRIW